MHNYYLYLRSYFFIYFDIFFIYFLADFGAPPPSHTHTRSSDCLMTIISYGLINNIPLGAATRARGYLNGGWVLIKIAVIESGVM